MNTSSNNKTLLIALIVAATSLVTAMIGPAFAFYHQRQQNELTNEKLEVIHTLVNSQLSTALTNELDALIRERTLLNELIELKSSYELPPSKEVLEVLDASQYRISELRKIINDRNTQQAIIDFQQE